MAKKPSTDDILAKLRAEKEAAAANEPGRPADPAPPEVAGEAPDSTSEPAAKPAAAKPAKRVAPASGSTADILAALRGEVKEGDPPAAAKPAKPAAAPKPAAGAPTGTGDILAALRAEKTGAAPAPPGTSPVAKPAVPKKGSAAHLPGGEKLSVEEMVRAARGGATPSAKPAAPAKPALPPMPQKPAAARKKEALPRRYVLVALLISPFVLAWLLFTAAATAATLGMMRFMMPNVLVEPPSAFKVGPPSDYPPGTVSNKWLARFGVWVVHAEYEGQDLVYALASVCTHLGCTPNWLEGEQKFKCPCHGSGFYITGINFEGPAPRPLERYAIGVAPDGMLAVDKSRKFQQELGQWEDPASKVEVA